MFRASSQATNYTKFIANSETRGFVEQSFKGGSPKASQEEQLFLDRNPKGKLFS